MRNFFQYGVVGDDGARIPHGRRGAFLGASLVDDQAVQETIHFRLAAFDMARFRFLLEKIGRFVVRDGAAAEGENIHHGGVIDVQDVPDSAEDVVVEHGFPLIRVNS
jgi:hypothetical protein